MSYWHSLALGFSTFCVLSCAGGSKPPPTRKPSRTPAFAVTVAPRVVESESPRPRLELLAIDERGRLRLIDENGKTKETLADDLRGAKLICSGNSRAAIVSTPTIARRYDVSTSTSKQIKIPPIEPCSSGAGCHVRRLTADPSLESACLELSDGPLATATEGWIVSLSFTNAPVAEIGQCLVESAPEPAVVSPGGRYSLRAEEGTCSDVCYETLVIVDEKVGRIVKSIAGILASTRIEWAPRGSVLLIGGTLHDAAEPDFNLELGSDACWLGE
jgi:hypothetical protein